MDKYVVRVVQKFRVLIMITTCFIKQNLQNYENFEVLNLAQRLTKFFEITCANFNKSEQLLKELWPKTHYDKNNKK